MNVMEEWEKIIIIASFEMSNKYDKLNINKSSVYWLDEWQNKFNESCHNTKADLYSATKTYIRSRYKNSV